MNRMDAYYDRFAQRKGWTLVGASVYTSTYGVLIALGLLQLQALYGNGGDSFYLYMAPLSLLVGVVGILHGAQVIRAVRRQKASGAKASLRG
jgi:hypothetical protein